MKPAVIVGTGLIALDVVYQGDATAPIRRCAGGTAGNVLTVLSYLGWTSVPVARLANDRARALVQVDLERWGVDTRFLDLAPQCATPIVVERIRRSDSREPSHSFSWTCPGCGAWLPRYKPVPLRSIQRVTDELRAPFVFFFDRPSAGAVGLAEYYSAAGSVVVFEPSAGGDRKTFGHALEIADIVKYSDQRFATLPPRTSLRDQLEIQTLGAEGLRYRFAYGRKSSAWRRLAAVPADHIADTAGSGDWCTAGFLAQLAGDARSAIAKRADTEIEAALKYGQALSAWNCGFAGARGGMYEQTREQFDEEIAALLDGARSLPMRSEAREAEPLDDLCPACPGEPVARSSARARASVAHA